MSKILFKGEEVTLNGVFPQVGSLIPDFNLTTNNLEDVTLNKYRNKTIILNIFPSIDTDVCASSVRTFNQKAANIKDTIVLCISKDLPFAQARFCGAENITNVQTLSAFRDLPFAQKFGVDIANGLLKGLLSRAIIVLDPSLKVIYTELVGEITSAPNYEKCLAALNTI